MSVQAITWALGVHGLAPRVKLVLIGLADSADKETWTCYPSRRSLAEICDCSIDTIDRALKALSDAGHVKIDARSRIDGAGQTSNIYTLHPSRRTAAPPVIVDDRGAAELRPPPPHSYAAPQPQSFAAPPAARDAAPYEPSLEPSCRIVCAPASKEAIAALIARAGDACDPTAPSLHSGAALNRLLRGGCDWREDIEPAVDQVAASFRRRRQRFNSWALLEEHAVRNRDARLAGLAAPQPASEVPRRSGAKASYADAITRVAKEMGIE